MNNFYFAKVHKFSSSLKPIGKGWKCVLSRHMPKFDLMFWDTLFVAKAALWFLEIEEESFVIYTTAWDFYL